MQDLNGLKTPLLLVKVKSTCTYVYIHMCICTCVYVHMCICKSVIFMYDIGIMGGFGDLKPGCPGGKFVPNPKMKN